MGHSEGRSGKSAVLRPSTAAAADAEVAKGGGGVQGEIAEPAPDRGEGPALATTGGAREGDGPVPGEVGGAQGTREPPAGVGQVRKGPDGEDEEEEDDDDDLKPIFLRKRKKR